MKLNLEKHQGPLLAQLRTGVLPLHIETGRFQNKKLEDRVCNICNTGAVESEYHFLFYCEFYSEQRNQFFEELHFQLGDKVGRDLHQLFKCHSRKLAKYVNKIFDRRQSKLYQKT